MLKKFDQTKDYTLGQEGVGKAGSPGPIAARIGCVNNEPTVVGQNARDFRKYSRRIR